MSDPLTMLLIETGHGPQTEARALANVLTRGPETAESIVDPLEVQTRPTPLAPVNEYRHRLQALRCEYVQLQLRTQELEKQLAQARSLIGVDASFAQLQSSRVWKIAVRGFRYWWTFSRWLRKEPHA